MSKRKVLINVFAVIVLLLFSLIAFIRQQYVAPILMYHSIHPQAKPENRLAVSTEAFRRQMSFLKRHRYNVLSLEDLANLIKHKKKIPHRTLSITFDDGYKDNYAYAFPILKEYSLPATIFIIINEVGRADRLSWDEIKEMQGSGLISFGSHTLTHKYLEEIKTEEELKKEVYDSKKILENKLAKPVNTFSYPSGRFTIQMRKLVIDTGYKLAVATNPGKKFPNDDIYALKRLRISSTSDKLFVFWIESSGYYTFIKEHRDED